MSLITLSQFGHRIQQSQKRGDFVGLYINKGLYPKVHLSSAHLKEVNQSEYRRDAMSEFLEFQQSMNQKLTESIVSVQQLFEKSNNTQQLQNITLNEAIENQESGQMRILNNLEKLEATVLEHLTTMNTERQELLKMAKVDENQQQALFAQLSVQDQKTSDLLNKIGELESFSKQLKQEMLASSKELSAKIEVQDMYHQTVMERIESQEAVTHKMNRQLDNLKAVIFERIADIAEKIDCQSKNTIKALSGIFIKPSKDSKTEKIK